MKISLRIFRFSRKVLFILCGVLLLGGVAGATAVYIGKDQLMGSAEEKPAALECTAVQVIKDHRDKQVWLRKYIKTEPADGMARVTTALRVAAALYEKEKPDLVQVVVLDENGPDKRASINGRAVGADVIYVPDPEKLASIGKIPTIQASYVDAMPTQAGEFFGTKMRMPVEEANQILASLPEKTDCADPQAELRAAAAAAQSGGHGGEDKGEAKSEGGHGDAKPEHGEGGDAKPADHGEEAPAEGEAGHGGEAKAGAAGEHAAAGAEKPEEDKGWFASVTGMVFGEDTPEETKEGASAGDTKAGHGDGEAQKSSDHGQEAPVEGEAGPDGEAKVDGEAKAAGEGHDAAAASEKPEEDKGWFASMTSMVFGEDEPAPAAEGSAGAETKSGHGEGEAAPAEEPEGEAASAEKHG